MMMLMTTIQSMMFVQYDVTIQKVKKKRKKKREDTHTQFFVSVQLKE